MGVTEKKERFDKLTGAHILWASTMGATFDLGVMSKAMLTPSMKTTAQRLVLHQMQKKTFPIIKNKQLNREIFKNILDRLNEFINFANIYEIELLPKENNNGKLLLKIERDSCMYCPTGVGGAQLGLAVCPYPQLFSIYLDTALKNSGFYKSVKMVKEQDGSHMHKEGEWDVITFDIEEDENFKAICNILHKSSEKIEDIMSNAIKDSKITEEELWDRNYVELPDADPKKYKTNFTDFAKSYIQPVEDSVLSMNKKFIFAVLVDDNGYLPAHNSTYDKPLTGNYETDLFGNRSMRIFNDYTGISAARNTNPILLQPYPRDTGILMYDISSPIHINNKHWGALRIGFKI